MGTPGAWEPWEHGNPGSTGIPGTGHSLETARSNNGWVSMETGAESVLMDGRYHGDERGAVDEGVAVETGVM